MPELTVATNTVNAKTKTCSACGGSGLILSTAWRSEPRYDTQEDSEMLVARASGECHDIERCDLCCKYATDNDAVVACYHLAMNALGK